MRPIVAMTVTMCALLATACTRTPTHNDGAATNATATKARPTTNDYRRYLRGNVMSFSSTSVSDWDAPDPSHVVVWLSPFEAYLLTLSGVCPGLETTHTMLLAAPSGVVRPGAGAVAVGPERCRIQFVERLDAKAMKADGVH